MRLMARVTAAIPLAAPLRSAAVSGTPAPVKPLPKAMAQQAAAQLPILLELAQPPALARQALLTAVSQLPSGHPRRRRYRLAVPFDTPLFPPDHLLRSAPGQPGDAGLDIWLALPPGLRRHDVLILPDEDYFWDDPQTGHAAPDTGSYAAQFIVHLMANGGGTALSIVQAHPLRRYGKTFHLLGRTGPGFYWDIRPAPPSPAAAATLADDLAQWLGATRQVV
ncbi:hypothetical protein GCM10027277_41590 [Pseudoduganella ginsengisoli]